MVRYDSSSSLHSEATSLEMDSCIIVAEQALETEQTKGSAS
jgi:hypothetical protein